MNEVRAPNKDDIKGRVKADYLKGIKPKELSEKYDISINTIKSWIKRYDWNKKSRKEGAPSKEKVAPSKKKAGAPKGNKNAVGNSGGAPPRNTNALKHGGYSKIYWDMLDDDEQELIEDIPADEEELLIEQIRLFSIRERRIMRAINTYRNTQGGLYVAGVMRTESKRAFKDAEEEKAYEDIQADKVKKKEILPGKSYQITTTTAAAADLINRLEKELTGVQAKKTTAIQTLTNLRLEREKMNGNQKGNDIVRAWAEKVMQSRGDNNG